MKRNQKGFGAVEGLLLVIIVLLVGFIGYYVHHSTKKESPAALASTNTNTDWKTYSDDLVSLEYPGTWSAVRDDNTSLPGTKQLELKGPDDKTVGQSAGIDSSHKASVVLTIFQNSKAGQNTCGCKVFDLMSLSMSQLPSAKLAVTSAPTGDISHPFEMALTTDAAAEAGAENIKEDLTVNNKTYNVWVDAAENDAVGSRINDVQQFEGSQSVKDAIKILNSVSFK